MRGAMPSGCRLTRKAFTGGSSRSGATPSSSTASDELAETRFQWASTITAG